MAGEAQKKTLAEKQKELSDAYEKGVRWVAMGMGAVSLIIALAFTITYADTLNGFENMECVACDSTPCEANDV